MLSRDAVDLVFHGRVATVERAGSTEITSFQVDRVWKGPVKKRMTIYRPLPASPAIERSSNFEAGQHYVVMAHYLNRGDRTALGLVDNERTPGMDACGDGSRPLSAVSEQDFRMLGPGGPPVDQLPAVRSPAVANALKIRDATPLYPQDALDAGVHGTVIVQITVDETGKVSDVSILHSIPRLDQAAIDCAKKWEYLPALFNGVPGPTTMTATVRFAQ